MPGATDCDRCGERLSGDAFDDLTQAQPTQPPRPGPFVAVAPPDSA